jgi:transposase InsO family protein
MERKNKPDTQQRGPYRRAGDEAFVIAQVRKVIDKRPSYGYRRVTALVNQELDRLGSKHVNHKRTYRIMKEQGLLLTRYSGRRVAVHNGQIFTLRSNMRWCSDAFVIQCWNGDRVNVAFGLDTCDREVLSYIATTVGMGGEQIRDLMVECVEHRFGKAPQLPHCIQWLSDNGSCYTARETVAFGRKLGFDIRTTPAYSPESNGMAEAFVKRFKQDYVWFGDLSSASKVLEQLPDWFEDYNEHAPHKALAMRSPRQYRRAQQEAANL